MTTREAAFSSLLLAWAGRGGLRSFPWRQETDPFRLLVAELMLRRTRAANVVGTYLQFVSRWPSVEDFVEAPPPEIAKLLQPLGLRWRADNLVQLQQHLRESGGAELYGSYETLLTLPGVGDYVASAVRCFSSTEARPLIDANSVRVISRVFGFAYGPETRRRQPFRKKAHEVLSLTDPRTYNYAVLDLAATVCTIHRPRCLVCPLVGICEYASTVRRVESRGPA